MARKNSIITGRNLEQDEAYKEEEEQERDKHADTTNTGQYSMARSCHDVSQDDASCMFHWEDTLWPVCTKELPGLQGQAPAPN